MLAFLTLLLGLTVGVQPVELAVGPQVHRIEVLLDGKTVATLRGSPWATTVDFGDRLLPHRLDAIAYDGAGAEIDRATQWVNLPRQPAESSLVIEGGAEGKGAIARLGWRSIRGANPIAIRVTFDGVPISVSDPAAIPLPDYDPDALHFLRAELDFPDNLSSVVELTVGGRWLARASSELTAIPIELKSKTAALEARDIGRQIRIDGRPVHVNAIEEGPAQILLIQDEEARLQFNGIVEKAQREARERRARFGFRALQRLHRSSDPLLTVLRSTDWIRFVWPTAQAVRQGDAAYDVFNYSRELTTDDGSFLSLLTNTHPPASLEGEQRLADAVAVAGLLATARSRRRVVILVTGSQPHDASEFQPAQVRAFLRALHVPLLVWSPETDLTGVERNWGQAEEISSLRSFQKAVKTVASKLERQRIIWVEGEFLPQRATLTPGARAIELAE